MSKAVPYIGFGNDELEKMAPVRETATCPGCGQSHTVEYGDEVKKDGTKVPSKLLGFVKCGETLYLVALGGKALHIEKNKPSVSGSIPLEEDIAPSA